MVIARAGSSPFYRQCFFQFLILGFSSDRPNIKNLKKKSQLKQNVLAWWFLWIWTERILTLSFSVVRRRRIRPVSAELDTWVVFQSIKQFFSVAGSESVSCFYIPLCFVMNLMYTKWLHDLSFCLQHDCSFALSILLWVGMCESTKHGLVLGEKRWVSLNKLLNTLLVAF